MYAQTWRFNPSDRKAKELLDSGEIGELIWISWTRLKPPYGVRHEAWSRWLDQGGGFWVWEGTHFTDQIRWFAGQEFSQAYSAGMGNYVSTGDGEDNGIGRGEWRFVGTNGMIEATSDEVRLGKGDWQTVDIGMKDDTAETDEFLASIIEGRQPIMTGLDGRTSLEAVLALHKSQETGQAVDIPMA
jgi:predicted dehydrogenase